jgi:pyruvate/2-oxoglutarate dehydrogenase complex dihydrolipoamide acyltransferase (E2) component
VENLMERFDDLVKQQQLLMEIDEGQAALHGSSSSSRQAAAGATPQGPAAEAAAAAADAAAAAIAAEEGAAGPLAAGSVVTRSSVLTPQHHVQLNKLRWAAGTGCVGVCNDFGTLQHSDACGRMLVERHVFCSCSVCS